MVSIYRGFGPCRDNNNTIIVDVAVYSITYISNNSHAPLVGCAEPESKAGPRPYLSMDNEVVE